MKICYYKNLSEKRIINLRDALQVIDIIDYRKCKVCRGYNINCEFYEPSHPRTLAQNIGRLEEIGVLQ